MFKNLHLPFVLDESRMNLPIKSSVFNSEIITNFIYHENQKQNGKLYEFYPVAKLLSGDKFKYLIFMKRTISDTICDAYYLTVFSMDGIQKDNKLIAGLFGNSERVTVREALIEKNMNIYTEKKLLNLKFNEFNGEMERRFSFTDYFIDCKGSIIEKIYQ